MKRKIILQICLMYLVCACNNSIQNTALSYAITGKDTLYVCNANDISRIEKTKLSNWLTDFKIVCLDNSDSALSRVSKAYVSQNYIALLGSPISTSPLKLFNKQGELLCDVGSIGNGPAEYQNVWCIAIDEQRNRICVVPIGNSNKISEYNLQGEFIRSFKCNTQLNKPQLRYEQDGSITVTHLCFWGLSNCQYARIYTTGEVSLIPPVKHMAVQPRDQDGSFIGFNNELWFLNNDESKFTFMNTASDTLYYFNPKNQQTTPRFTMNNHENIYCRYTEFPTFFLAQAFGDIGYEKKFKSSTIFINKQSSQASFVEIANDFVGNLPVSGFGISINNGWFCEMYEPYKLLEIIEKRLSESNCSAQDKNTLKQLKESINEDDNNILFIGKIKEDITKTMPNL